MSIYSLTFHPNDLLRKNLSYLEVKKLISPEMQKIIDAMVETMYAKDGVGLASNQVGKDFQIAILNTQEGPQTIVNPRIVKKSILKENGEEGCLSIPGVFGEVRRHRSVTLEALDRNGKPLLLEAKGLLARVIQHEVDHLNGILCIDRMEKVTHGKMPDGRKKV